VKEVEKSGERKGGRSCHARKKQKSELSHAQDCKQTSHWVQSGARPCE
jgi:hypothetical protein